MTKQAADLITHQAYINGKWINGNLTFPVLNPFDGKVITEVSDLGKKEAHTAIEAAHRSFPDWSSRLATEREEILLHLADLIEKNVEALACLLTFEQGKPLHEAKEEIQMGLHALKWSAAEGTHIHAYTQCDPDGRRNAMTIRQPMGVAAIITPWNFPFAIPLQKFSAALAAGCTVILKPAEDTPLSSLALAKLCEQAGVPPGVFNVLTCLNPEEVGSVLTSDPLVAKISFTGSTEVGRQLLAMSASTVKRVTLEMGGNCPFIVFEDADLDQALDGAMRWKFYNAGQCCIAINRFLVHESIYDSFIEKFAEKAAQLTVGSGLKNVDLGPLINQAAKDKVENLLSNATKQKAKFVLHPKHEEGLLCSPVVIKHANRNMQIWKEEIFGPVAPFYSFKTEEEAIAMANDTRYGLAAYFYSKDVQRTMRVARALQAGSVGINTTDVYSYQLPFGGWKASGLGREGGILESLNDYCELKALSFGH